MHLTHPSNASRPLGPTPRVSKVGLGRAEQAKEDLEEVPSIIPGEGVRFM